MCVQPLSFKQAWPCHLLASNSAPDCVIQTGLHVVIVDALILHITNVMSARPALRLTFRTLLVVRLSISRCQSIEACTAQSVSTTEAANFPPTAVVTETRSGQFNIPTTHSSVSPQLHLPTCPRMHSQRKTGPTNQSNQRQLELMGSSFWLNFLSDAT